MAFIPVPDVAEIVMSYRGPNLNIMKNVYHVREATLGVWTPDGLAVMANVFSAWENSSGKAQRSNQITCFEIACRDLGSEDSFIYTLAVNHVGSIASAVMPANVTYAVKSTTGRAGRSYRGRSYWIGLPEGNVSGDFLNAPYSVAIVNALNALRTSVEASPPGFKMVVVSRYSNGAPRTQGVATDILSWQAVDLRVDTQRRRLIGEGQ